MRRQSRMLLIKKAPTTLVVPPQLLRLCWGAYRPPLDTPRPLLNATGSERKSAMLIARASDIRRFRRGARAGAIAFCSAWLLRRAFI